MKTSISARSFIGLIFVVAATLILLSNTGVIANSTWKPILISWQSLLIVIGIYNLINNSYRSGLFCLVIGSIFIIPKILPLVGLNYPDSTVSSIMWTLVLIIIGFWLMFGHRISNNKTWRGHYCKGVNGKNTFNVECTDDGVIDYNLLMNGVDEIFLKPVFRGGKISTMMGGVKLDLRKTSLPDGDTKLKVDSMWGGVTLIVPETWNIEIHSSSIIGGFTDNRMCDETKKDCDKKLIIEASFLMGGGDIRC